MIEGGNADLYCARCGSHSLQAPFQCPLGGELDVTEDIAGTAYFGDGVYKLEVWCENGERALVDIAENMIDPATTAEHVRSYAEEEGYDVRISWGARYDDDENWRDVVLCLQPHHLLPADADILGIAYSECINRLDQLMSPKSDSDA